MEMRVVPECPGRMISWDHEFIECRLALGNFQEHIVGAAPGRNMQAMKVEVGWLRQMVIKVDAYRFACIY